MREQGGWGLAVGGRLLFLTLCLSERNMQKLREEKVHEEGKRKLPCVRCLLFPGRHFVNFGSALNHPEKQEDHPHSEEAETALEGGIRSPRITQPAGDRARI